MKREIAAVRIWPMSGKIEGFVGRSIENVQRNLFLRELPRRGGRFSYPRIGLNAEPGTILLFQYHARIIASAEFLFNEKFDRPIRECAGRIHVDIRSIRIFDPLDVQAMRKVWPSFRGFGHVKQFLNPTLYPQFKRGLRHVAAPEK